MLPSMERLQRRVATGRLLAVAAGVAVLVACGGQGAPPDPCAGAQSITFSACAGSTADPSAPVIDRFEGPSCAHASQVGSYHLVFHDDDDRVTTIRLSGPKYPAPKDETLNPPVAKFDNTAILLVGGVAGDYEVHLSALDETGYRSAEVCGVVSVH